MKNIVAIVVSVVALALSITVWVLGQQSSKLAYVELSTVFTEFEMTKQYRAKLETTINARKGISDSLEMALKAQSRSFSENSSMKDPKVQQFMYDKEMYVQKVKQFTEDNQALQRQYDMEINKQITQYVKEYGESKGYRYIFGADGSGSMMYAQPADNITKDVIEYINKKYKGVAK